MLNLRLIWQDWSSPQTNICFFGACVSFVSPQNHPSFVPCNDSIGFLSSNYLSKTKLFTKFVCLPVFISLFNTPFFVTQLFLCWWAGAIRRRFHLQWLPCCRSISISRSFESIEHKSSRRPCYCQWVYLSRVQLINRVFKHFQLYPDVRSRLQEFPKIFSPLTAPLALAKLFVRCRQMCFVCIILKMLQQDFLLHYWNYYLVPIVPGSAHILFVLPMKILFHWKTHVLREISM